MSQAKTPVLIWSATVRADLVRLRKFIEPHNPEAARNAAQTIKKATQLIQQHAGIGMRLWRDGLTVNSLSRSASVAMSSGIALMKRQLSS
ncbi:MAG: type II toxin-antitoxin system RelE/ParE family toxin [Methylococcales bacterium]